MTKTKTELVGVRLDPSLAMWLRVHAAKTKQTMSQIASDALIAYRAGAR